MWRRRTPTLPQILLIIVIIKNLLFFYSSCSVAGGISTTAPAKPGGASSFVNVTATVPSHPGDLEELQSILHFPEEVALRLTDAEYQLFYQVTIREPFPCVVVVATDRPSCLVNAFTGSYYF